MLFLSGLLLLQGAGGHADLHLTQLPVSVALFGFISAWLRLNPTFSAKCPAKDARSPGLVNPFVPFN